MKKLKETEIRQTDIYKKRISTTFRIQTNLFLHECYLRYHIVFQKERPYRNKYSVIFYLKTKMTTVTVVPSVSYFKVKYFFLESETGHRIRQKTFRRGAEALPTAISDLSFLKLSINKRMDIYFGYLPNPL